MAHFSFTERLNGLYSFLKAELVDAPIARSKPLPDADVTGKVILMTGATSGIGKETARRLAISGAHLIITARNEKRGNSCVLELIEATKNPNIEYLYMDLCDLKSVEAAAEKVQRNVPHLDVLLNCAGRGYIDSWMMTNDGNEVLYTPRWRRINTRMQTNYLGPYLLTHRLLPLLIASGTPSKPSRIVFVSSESHYTCSTFAFEDINNLESLPFNSLQYVISKFLCTVQTMALADQLKDQNVVVHAVCPGLTITELWDQFPDGQKAFVQFLQRFSIGNSVSEAASNVILVTSSQEAERCTGGYWANMDKVPPCPKVLDKKLQKDIVEKTNQLLNL